MSLSLRLSLSLILGKADLRCRNACFPTSMMHNDMHIGLLPWNKIFWAKADRSLLHHGPKISDIDVRAMHRVMLTDERKNTIRNCVPISSKLVVAAYLPFKDLVQHLHSYFAPSLCFTWAMRSNLGPAACILRCHEILILILDIFASQINRVLCTVFTWI